jgi:hypothetical protein
MQISNGPRDTINADTDTDANIIKIWDMNPYESIMFPPAKACLDYTHDIHVGEVAALPR